MNLQEFGDYYNSRSWLRKKYWRACGIVKDLSRLPGKIHNVYRRARYGIGPRDSFSLDTYIAKVVAQGTLDLATRNFSYPGEERGWTAEEWNLFLMELSAAMYNYSMEDRMPDASDTERAKKALHDIADVFDWMWD